ncbi:alpha/beta hydrolase [Oxalobacteraceae bacterium]|nr:alpha/beta hydrolase [Oxalobacteraceae bacterium]
MLVIYLMGGLAPLLLALLALLLLERLAPLRAAPLALALDRRRAGLRLGSQAIPGAIMPYLEGGSGRRPSLVLVHGFAGDKDNFTRVAAHLSGHYHVLLPDLPGFGDASRDPEGGYSVAQQVAYLRAFLQARGLERVHLGGSSMGGFIVTEYAARYPEQVASLWLLDAAGTAASFSSPMLAHYRDTGEMPLLLPTLAHGPGLFRATMEKIPFIPYCVRHQLAARCVADFPLHSRIMDVIHRESPLLEAQFSRIDTPALIVWGTLDKVLSPSGAAALRALLPNSEVEMMEGLGHLPMIEAPRRTARRYRRFLQGLPVNRPAIAAPVKAPFESSSYE